MQQVKAPEKFHLMPKRTLKFLRNIVRFWDFFSAFSAIRKCIKKYPQNCINNLPLHVPQITEKRTILFNSWTFKHFAITKIQIDNEYNLLRKQFFLFGVAYCSYTWLSIAYTDSRGGLKQLLKTWYVWVGKLKKWIYHGFIIKYKHI